MSILYITAGGAIVGAQRWSVGTTLFLPTSPAPTPAQLATLANGYFADFNTNVWSAAATPLRGKNGPSVTFDQIRVYQKLSSSSPAIVVGVSTTAAVSGNAGPQAPAQTACVATLETGLSGRSYRGRMYLPYTTPTMASTFLIGSSDATALSLQIANYLSAIQLRSVAGGAAVPVVSSQTATAPITAVSVDTVLDTQRRRRDKIVGSRQRSTVVAG